jgi:phosphoribosylamine--glycine ligase
MINILIVGSGGREHAFTWKASQSDLVEKIFVAPGNAGTSLEPKTENIDIGASDIEALISFSKKEDIDLVIVGPEDPLVNGITDEFKKFGIKCFGPESLGAQLEGSKDFAKAFMKRHNIPTAGYESFTNANKAKKYIQENKLPLVIKADGLAAGKGVVIVEDYETAFKTIDQFIGQTKFGDASKKIIIEDFLRGQELSYIVMVNGSEYLPLATSQDHKTIGEGDIGLNTGGMGAYSPVPFANDELDIMIKKEVIEPTIRGLSEDGIGFRGFLYAGLMIDSNLNPRVLEYNCRFGDPETQPIMLRLKSDLIDMIQTCFSGDIGNYEIEWDKKSAMGVVMSSDGYPESYETGKVISGLDSLVGKDDIKVFHSGTRIKNEKVLTNGGRVLCVTALGDDLNQSNEKAYSAVNELDWDGKYYRKDIGFRVMK